MRLALFFTKGVSLKVWDRVGHLDREIKPYQKLADYFEEIYFLTYGGREELNYQTLLGSKIKILPNRLKLPALLYSLLAPFFHWKELRKTDIFKTNQVLGAWTAVIAKVFFKKKLIARQGRQWSVFAEKEGVKKWKLPIIRSLEKLVYKKADTIIIASEQEKKFIQEKYNIPLTKINLIPNYIDTDLFKPLDVEKENRICFVGRLEEQKNLFNLIKAVAGLDITLVIFGSGSQKETLEKLSRELKARIEFKGNIANKDLPKELNKSKLFILPSFYEGCPKVLLEAMSCGLLVIGTDVEGTKEIIKHKENGYLCNTSADSIKEALIEVLKNEDGLGRRARETVLNNFSLKNILEKEIKIYQKI